MRPFKARAEKAILFLLLVLLNIILFNNCAKSTLNGDSLFLNDSAVLTPNSLSSMNGGDIVLTNLPNLTTTSTQATVNFSASTAGATVYCRIDQNLPVLCPNPVIVGRDTPLSAGPHSIDYFVDSGSGMSVSAPTLSYTWNILSVLPPNQTNNSISDSLISVSNLPPLVTTATSATFNFQALVRGSTVYCRLDSASVSTICTDPLLIGGTQGLALGPHRLDFYVATPGNLEPAQPTLSYTWNILSLAMMPTPTPVVNPTPISIPNGTQTQFKPESGTECLQIQGASTAAGAGLIEQNCDGSATQNFIVVTNSNNTFSLRNSNSGLCLDAGNSSTTGIQVVQTPCTYNGSQTWQLLNYGGGTYAITSANGAGCLDVYDGQTVNGTIVETYACHLPATNEIFVASGLGPVGGTTASPTITQFSFSNTDTTLTYQFTYSVGSSNFQVFIDSDMNASSGYRLNSGMGADYMIQNSRLFKYAGAGTDWTWTDIGSTTFLNNGGVASFTINRSLINETGLCAPLASNNVVAGVWNSSQVSVAQISFTNQSYTPSSTCGP